MDQSIKKMDLLSACQIVEGDVEASDEDIQAAWQYLYDRKAYNFLQGWYGRSMAAMLDSGYIVDQGVEA
jgi:hypothetical protein